MISRYLAQPRTGDLVQALHIFRYINELAFDPAYHNVKDPVLVQYQMKAMIEMYPDAIKDLPPILPRIEVIMWKLIVSLIVTMPETMLHEDNKLSYYYT